MNSDQKVARDAANKLKILRLLFPDGVSPERIGDMLLAAQQVGTIQQALRQRDAQRGDVYHVDAAEAEPEAEDVEQ